MSPVRPVLLAGFGLVGAVLLAAVSTAQLPSSNLKLAATPSGDWAADGVLDAGRETATWAVDAMLTFSATAQCPSDPELGFFIKETRTYIDSSIEPTTAAIHVPTGGGTVHAFANATAIYRREAPAPQAEPFQFTAILEACPDPTGTQPGVQTTANASVQTLFRPTLNVTADRESSINGTFHFLVRNEGNGPVRVTVSLEGGEGTDPAAFDPAAPFPLSPTVDKLVTLQLDHLKPGSHVVRFVARYDGPGADALPRGEANRSVEVLAPPPSPTAKNSPAWGLLASFIAVGVAFGRDRRV